MIKLNADWSNLPRRDEKACCIVRYGAFGDMIQASSIFPALKKQGWKVVVNTSPRGYDVIKHDPHVDEIILQEKDQVPNAQLTEYWLRLSERFGKFVNLSESVEGSLLALAGERSWAWSKEFRDLMFSVDYVDGQHACAGIEAKQQQHFYPNIQERQEALKWKKSLSAPVIFWALSGSAVHKAYPHADSVIAQVLLKTKGTVVLAGDDFCKILESGWENEERVIKLSGEVGIRTALVRAQVADVVVGPETGILNAVSLDNMKKVLMLSHSSRENFKRWINTVYLEPENCECFPCHKLHYGWETCSRDDETGAAKCAAFISPKRVYEAITLHRKG